MKLLFSRIAINDLSAIEENIAESSWQTAVRICDSLRLTCGLLADNPHLGSTRDDVCSGLRYFPHSDSKYLIFYTIAGDCVHIVRVLHGSLDYIKEFD